MTAEERSRKLLTEPVGPTLLRLAGPTAIGIFAILLFNVVDTYWVGRLGHRELAAMSFTFPVTFVVMNICIGLGIGLMAAVARAFGSGDRADGVRLTSDGLLLAVLVVAVVSMAGLWLHDPIFRALGASEDLLPRIREYMTPWFVGVVMLAIPMVGNSATRATGDTKTPGFIMLGAGLVNSVLDPLFIFGWGPFPRLELFGAALSTVLSWAAAMAAAFWMLGVRDRMLSLKLPRVADVLNSWRRILYVGLPTAATQLLVPVSAAVLTRLVSSYGESAVAAFGVGQRVESLALIGIMALCSSVAPFAGQNMGAQRMDRVREALGFGARATTVWGIGVALLLALFARPIAHAFSDAEAVRTIATRYFYVVPLSYAGYGAAMLANSALAGISRPAAAATLTLGRLFGLTLPLAWLGARSAGPIGMFLGMAAANVLSGVVSLGLTRRTLSLEA
ncbi:MAG: MATE family efflux transporter [Polyangiaceae bacterium]